MNYDEFRTVCESVFAGLIMRYGFRRPTAKRESGDIYNYNLTTARRG